VRLDEAVASARRLLARTGRRPAVVAHDLWIASGLETALPETVLICLQRCSAADGLRQRGVEVFCLSEQVGSAATAGLSSLELLEHPATRDFCSRLAPLALLTFKPSERLAAAAAGLGADLVTGDLRAARAAENKLHFIDIAGRAGVATPRWEAVSLRDGPDFDDLRSRLGDRMVLQGARGNAGRRTWLVERREDLALVAQVERGGRVRAAEFVGGLPFTATGLCGPADGGGALRAWIEPCRQLTGIEWLTPVQLGSCGNAWGDPQLEAQAGAVVDALARIADELDASGYRGLFGVDFVLDGARPVVIETNPRMVASLPLATQAEVAADRAPLLLQTLRQHLGAELERVDPEPPLRPVSQVIVHRIAGDREGERLTRSGAYRLTTSAAPEFVRDGAWLSDIEADDEALVLTRDAGEPISAGMEFARVYLRGSDAEARAGLRRLVDALRGGA
jgi:hypothetical protein